MRKLYRFLLSTYAMVTALVALLFLSLLLNPAWVTEVPAFFARVAVQNSLRMALALLSFLIFGLSLGILYYALSTGRLRKTRLKMTDIGLVEIGVDAIESIALNAARAAQAGIKTAKARVYADKGRTIKVELTAGLYSDVEIPAQMAKIQERIKKDVERYTGIPVSAVVVHVARVELVGAKVERR